MFLGQFSPEYRICTFRGTELLPVCFPTPTQLQLSIFSTVVGYDDVNMHFSFVKSNIWRKWSNMVCKPYVPTFTREHSSPLKTHCPYQVSHPSVFTCPKKTRSLVGQPPNYFWATPEWWHKSWWRNYFTCNYEEQNISSAPIFRAYTIEMCIP